MKGFLSVKLPKGVWVLGFVSLFMDTSTELINSILPVFLTNTLGASMLTIGIIEGFAEAVTSVSKIFSGLSSDYFRRRKIPTLLGYLISALAKPLFPLATSVSLVFTARFLDRMGKGIRGAPRDALLSEITPQHLWGSAYGLRQALDSFGAFLGPLFALAFMLKFHGDAKSVLWIGVFPAFASVLLLSLGVKENPPFEIREERERLRFCDVRFLPKRYWIVVVVGIVLYFARFSQAFFLLRAHTLGLYVGYVPSVMMLMNIVDAFFSYPAGSLADRIHKAKLLIFGFCLLFLSHIVLSAAQKPFLVFVGSALFGLHMAFTQGLFSKLVADSTPSNLRATGFGIFYLVSGVTLLLSNIMAGSFWTIFGAEITFLIGAFFSASALIALIILHKKWFL